MLKCINLKFLFIALVLFSNCSGFKPPKYTRLSDKIAFPYAKELKESKGLYLNGFGGAMMDDIKKVNSSYVSLARLNIDEARELYVDVMEGYLERYNNNEEIRPYLHNYPFTIENIELMISFEDENKKLRSGGDVALISIIRGRMYYRSYDLEEGKFVDLHDEPYEEAVRIVRGGEGEL